MEGLSKEQRKRRKLSGDEIAGVKKNRRWWPFKKKDQDDDEPNERKLERQQRRAEKQEERLAQREARDNKKPIPADMTIELTGGGFFGGIDPVMRDYTVIKPGGRLIKEFKSVHTDLRRTATDIDVEEYNRLAQFIVDQGFFELERSYDCHSEMCMNRKRLKPTPVPLRIAVSTGKQFKVVNVSIWGLDERNVRYVDYPDELENIIQAVLKVSNGAEFSFAKG